MSVAVATVNCDQCEALMINGVYCHEAGCPNQNAKWDADRDSWIRYFDCFTCGFPVERGEHCNCQDDPEFGHGIIMADADFDEDEHSCDADCSPDDETGTCVTCGVVHDAPCPSCGGRGFHNLGCTD